MPNLATLIAAARRKLANLTPAETWCCLRLPCQHHRLSCPYALSRICDDCQAEPGQECTWSCSSNWR